MGTDTNELAFRVEPVRLVQERKAYRVPRHGAPMDLYLDGNEGQPPDASLYDALTSAGIDAAARYPSAAKLEASIAAHWQRDKAQVLVTAGADDAIDRLSRVMLAEGKAMIFPTPSFEMMARYGEVAGGTIERVEWPVGAPYPLAGVLDKIDENTGIIAVISPNNPSGVVTSAATVHTLAKAAPHAIVLYDLAYVEFADEDPTLEALELPNVVVTRTLSKAWGLAGLRIGYALGHPQLLEWMRVAGEPYAVAGPSLVLAAARLKQADQVDAFVTQVRKERTELEALLGACGMEVTPSQGNFVFARDNEERVAWLKDALAGLGIAIRTFPGNPALRGGLRITCPGNEASFARLLHGTQSALEPEAMIFDMDGVMVDVSASYREAIIQTAAHFGVVITHADIAATKAAGNANNDWIVTQRLLEQAGKSIALDAVTEVFEQLYQGTPDKPGLRERETLLVEPAWLEQCKKAVPMAIVTGRPRQDALLLLERFGLLDLFDAIVCMEDAPAKPDPAPVNLALEQLGVTRAWMLGDTPDDIVAARAAGVVPLGVVAPNEDPVTTAARLIQAGAARAFSSVTDPHSPLTHATQHGGPSTT